MIYFAHGGVDDGHPDEPTSTMESTLSHDTNNVGSGVQVNPAVIILFLVIVAAAVYLLSKRKNQ